MPRPKFATVDDYIAVQPERMQTTLERVRGAIRKAVPRAQECISYNIPAYKLESGPVVFFAAFKNHYSIYPATSKVKTALKDLMVDGCEVENATIRFSWTGAVPVKLIQQFAKVRAQELDEGRRSKSAAK